MLSVDWDSPFCSVRCAEVFIYVACVACVAVSGVSNVEVETTHM